MIVNQKIPKSLACSMNPDDLKKIRCRQTDRHHHNRRNNQTNGLGILLPIFGLLVFELCRGGPPEFFCFYSFILTLWLFWLTALLMRDYYLSTDPMREYLTLPLRQGGSLLLAPAEEDGEDPAERYVMDSPTTSRQCRRSVGSFMPLRHHLHGKRGRSFRLPHVKAREVGIGTLSVAQRHLAKENPGDEGGGLQNLRGCQN